jgi:hypothetical protein
MEWIIDCPDECHVLKVLHKEVGITGDSSEPKVNSDSW